MTSKSYSGLSVFHTIKISSDDAYLVALGATTLNNGILWTILISNLLTANWLRFLNFYITAGIILSQSSNLLTFSLCYFGSNVPPMNLKFTKAEYSISQNTLSWSWASLMNYPSIASVTAISNYMLALNQNQEI